MPTRQLSGAPYNQNATYAVESEGDSELDTSVKACFVKVTGTIKLSLNPAPDQEHLLCASSAGATVDGNGHPIVGPATLSPGDCVRYVFSADAGTWFAEGVGGAAGGGPAPPDNSVQVRVNSTTFGSLASFTKEAPGGGGFTDRLNIDPTTGFISWGAVAGAFPLFGYQRFAEPAHSFLAYNPLMVAELDAIAVPLVMTRVAPSPGANVKEVYLACEPRDTTQCPDITYLGGQRLNLQNAATTRWNMDNLTRNQNGIKQEDLIGSVNTPADTLLRTIWDTTAFEAPVTPNCLLYLKAFVQGSTAGSTKVATFEIAATFTVVGGVWTQLGATRVIDVFTSDPVWDAIFDTAGAAGPARLRVRTNNDAAQWTAEVRTRELIVF